MAVEKMVGCMMVSAQNAIGLAVGHRLHSMKKLVGRILLFALAWVTLTGCGHNELIQIERIMESDVQKADSMIQSMNEPAGKRNQALYALLKTQIDYKMYRNADGDSTIRVATDYYGRKYKGYHAAMAWYSLGCISSESGKDSTAADAYLTALSLFPDTLVRYYALTEQNLSHIFLEHKMGNEAMPLIRSCRANAVRLKDSAAIAFCDYSIAKSYMYNNIYDKALELFLNLKDSKWLTSPAKELNLIHLSKIELLYTHNYTKSICYTDSFLINNCNRVPNGAAYTIKADAFYCLNQMDSARHYYQMSILDSDDPYAICDSYRHLAEIQSILGNQDSVTYYTKKVSDWTDEIVSTSNSELILKAMLRNSQTCSTPYNQNHIIFIILIIVGILTVIMVSIGWLIRTNKDSVSEVADNTVSQIEATEQAPIERKESGIMNYSREIDDFKSSELYQIMMKASHEYKEIATRERKSFETGFHNSLVELRKLIISLSNHLTSMELDYCIVTLLGFKQRDFHLFFNISYSGSRNIKSRVKYKMPEYVFCDIFGTDTDSDTDSDSN